MGQLGRFFAMIRDWRWATLMVLVLFACLAGGSLQGRHIALERLDAIFDQSSASRKNLFRLEIQGALSVPQVLAASRSVQWLLDAPNSIAVEEENAVLEETARNVGLDVIYVMDINGNCLAASNWRAQDSFVGENYAFRSYFKQALDGQTGRYIAKGVTSMKVGYYLSRPVKTDDDILGVVVAKMSFDTLRARIEEFWRIDEELDLVTDENGVVVVSPLNALVFKSIEPIPDETRSAIIASREYGNQILPVPLKLGSVLSDRVRFVEFNDIPGHSFLQKSYYFPDLGLRLYLHLPVSIYWGIVAEFTAIFSLLAFVIFLIGVIIFQRW
ncbi:MAG: hypothetical protein ABI081_00215, partial [Burkholderiaceae bacterium]